MIFDCGNWVVDAVVRSGLKIFGRFEKLSEEFFVGRFSEGMFSF